MLVDKTLAAVMTLTALTNIGVRKNVSSDLNGPPTPSFVTSVHELSSVIC